LLRTRIKHLRVFDRCHDIFEEPNKVKTQIQPPPFHCGTPPKCPPTVRSEGKNKTSTLAPASLSRSTESVPPIIKVPRELFLCQNVLLPTTPFDDRLAVNALPALLWRPCRIKYPRRSGANPPGLSQIVDDIKRHGRKQVDFLNWSVAPARSMGLAGHVSPLHWPNANRTQSKV
jgi:hypothetical protein